MSGFVAHIGHPCTLYVRGRGYSVEAAQDLTQAYFERLLEKNYDHANALKRGSCHAHVALDLNWDKMESGYSIDPGHNVTPERIFEQRWALTLLERARTRLAAEMCRAGKQEQFRRLETLASGEEADVSYRDIAKALGTSEGAIKVAVHRLRRRFRELLRDEVGQTVDSPDQADQELRFLLKAIGGS